MINNIGGVNQANPTLSIWKNDKVEENKEPVLSAAALSYLEELKEKFGNIDFIIADYSSESEAQRLLQQGNGEYNCLITPALLEEMAANAESRDKYEGIIANAVTQVDEMKETLAEKSGAVKSYGFSVDASGNVSYYVLLNDGLPKSFNGGSKVVKAGSIEELLEKLDQLDEERQTEKQYEKRKERYAQFEDGFDKGKGISEILKEDIDRKIRGKNQSQNEDGDFDFQA